MPGLSTRHDGISPRLQALISKGQNKQGAFARVYPVYQRLQTQRFETQNASEGAPWHALEKRYEQYKLTRYGGGSRRAWVGGRGENRPWRDAGAWKSWPGGGRKMLLGTSTLAGAVIGPGQTPLMGTNLQRAQFTDDRMTIAVETGGTNAEGRPFDYAKFVAEERPFMRFSDTSIAEMRAEVRKFMIGGDE